jgi:hypothetical protein
MNQRIYAGAYCIAWDDAWHCIEINGCFLNLSPTQYRICRAFFLNCGATNGISGELVILAYKSFQELQEATTLSRSLLIKHISNLNSRIADGGLQVCSFQLGYILTLSSNSGQKVQQSRERKERTVQ